MHFFSNVRTKKTSLKNGIKGNLKLNCVNRAINHQNSQIASVGLIYQTKLPFLKCVIKFMKFYIRPKTKNNLSSRIAKSNHFSSGE